MDLFWLQIALSFIAGGLYIAASIRVAEAFGPQWGGLIIALPNTSLVSFVFIGLTQGTQALTQAIPIVPLAFGMNLLFVLAYIYLHRFGWKTALVGALAFWAAVMLPATMGHLDNLGITLTFALAAILIARHLSRFLPSQTIAKPRFSKAEFLFRAGFSGLIVASAVYLVKTQGPLWGGLMAGFPAAFTSTMILLSRRHGIGFASSVAKNMPLGMAASLPYLVAIYFFLPQLGLWLGLALAYAVSLTCAFLIQQAVKNKTEEPAALKKHKTV